MTLPVRYRAFISYSRADRVFAKKLQRQLEAYVLPSALRAMEPGVRRQARSLRPIFRDEDELVPGEDLPDRIRRALTQSQFLIVVCSPDAGKSKWVEREVNDFIALSGTRNIVAVVVAGEPNAQQQGYQPETECLPQSLRAHEPLWLDWRIPRPPRLVFLRLVASLLSLASLDDLVQRDRARKLRQRVATLTVALALGFGSTASAVRISKLVEDRTAARAEEIAASARRLLMDDDVEGAARAIVLAGNIDQRANFDSDFWQVLIGLKRLGPPLQAHGNGTNALYLRSDLGVLLEADDNRHVYAWDLKSATAQIVGILPAGQEANLLGSTGGKLGTVYLGTIQGDIWVTDLSVSPLKLSRVGTIEQPVTTFAHFGGEDYALGSFGRVMKISEEGVKDLVIELAGSVPETSLVAANITTEGDIVAVSLEGNYSERTMNILSWRIGSPEAPKRVPAVQNSSDQSCAAVSRSSKLIVTGSCSGLLQLWDSGTGRQIAEPLVGHRGTVEQVLLSPDESLLASAGSDTTIRYWTAGHGSMWTGRLKPVLRGHTDAIRSIVFSEDGQQLASASDDGTIRIWDMRATLFARDTYWTALADDALDLPVMPYEEPQTAIPVLSEDGSTRISLVRPGTLEILDAKHNDRAHVSIDENPFRGLLSSGQGNAVAVEGYSGLTVWRRGEVAWGEPNNPPINAVGPYALSDKYPLVDFANRSGRVSLFDYEREILVAQYSGMHLRGTDSAKVLTLRFDASDSFLTAETEAGTHTWPVPMYETMVETRLATEICEKVLPSSLRIVTEADAAAEPALAEYVGVDVCASKPAQQSRGVFSADFQLPNLRSAK